MRPALVMSAPGDRPNRYWFQRDGLGWDMPNRLDVTEGETADGHRTPLELLFPDPLGRDTAPGRKES